ncbi:MAG: sodium-dependent transporter, partial [Hungatella sp.]
DGGGVFLLFYIILALTFGFTLLATEIAIGRKTRQSPLTAYGKLHKKWGGIGILACLVPILILPYYCSIGGWVLKYLSVYLTGQASAATADTYFSSFISKQWEPIIWLVIYLSITAFIVYKGVNQGIEKYSRILMPILLVLITGVAIFSLTLTHTDANGVTRTGLEGLKVYMIPDFTGMTAKKLFAVLSDALGQLFYSISVAMGIMIAYGSYVSKETDLNKAINRIEIFDTLVAVLAGIMIVPAVYTFMGVEGMSAGPSLMFVSLPKVFSAMGTITAVGFAFFLMVAFAAVTSSVSVMEAIVSSLIDRFSWTRQKATVATTLFSIIVGIVVCLGYNVFYFELTLPNGTVAQILDVLDYISNSCLMPLVAFLTCILVGWVLKPDVIIEEAEQNGHRFRRKQLYIVMIKVIAPALLFLLLVQALGLFSL